MATQFIFARGCDQHDTPVASGRIPAVLSRRFATAPPSARGFSLVEVTLAMGIAAFGLLVIFSMLPTGMATTQNTGRQVAETEIFNRIGSELAATPIYSDPIAHVANDALYTYVQPATNARFPAYFDIEGNEVTSTSKLIAFTVQCSIEKADAATNNAVWTPLSQAWGMGEIRWATVRIGFHKDPGATNNPLAAPDPLISKRTFVLSNRGT